MKLLKLPEKWKKRVTAIFCEYLQQSDHTHVPTRLADTRMLTPQKSARLHFVSIKLSLAHGPVLGPPRYLSSRVLVERWLRQMLSSLREYHSVPKLGPPRLNGLITVQQTLVSQQFPLSLAMYLRSSLIP